MKTMTAAKNYDHLKMNRLDVIDVKRNLELYWSLIIFNYIWNYK